MPRTADPALEDAGLSEEAVAQSISRVFGLMTGAEEAGDPVGWAGVVSMAREVLGGHDESEVHLSLPDFSDMLRTAYGKSIDPDYELHPAPTLQPLVRMGWEAVTRHLLNVFALDPQEARRLEQHEANIVAFVKKRSATPK